MMKSKLKISYDIMSVTSSVLCHETNVTRFFYFGPLPIKISCYANDIKCRR